MRFANIIEQQIRTRCLAEALFVRLICRRAALYRPGYIGKAAMTPNPLLAVVAFWSMVAIG